MDTQKLYEVQVAINDESFLLTKDMRSPFVKSDVFALPKYKRTNITLVAGAGMVLQSAKAFFDCKIDSSTQIIMQNGNCNFTCENADLTPKIPKEPTLMDKIFGFFKRELPKEEFPSTSFICLKNGEDYHFFGAITESLHTVSFDALPLENQIVCKINSENVQSKDDCKLFDIVEINGSIGDIIESYYSIVENLYKRTPKATMLIDSTSFDMTKTSPNAVIDALSDTKGFVFAFLKNGDDHSMSSLVKKASTFIYEIGYSASSDVLPIIEFSPLLCEKTSPEYSLFSSDLVTNEKGRPITVSVNGKNFFVLDIFSKSVKSYIASQLEALFGMGFVGVKFVGLEYASVAKHGKTLGETQTQIYRHLSDHSNGKLTFASFPNQNNALGYVDYSIISADVTKSPEIIGKTPAETIPAKWDFSGFENLISYFEVNQKLKNALPVAVPSSLLLENPQLFDLCTALNFLLCQSFNIQNATKESLARTNEFFFMKSAETTEIIKIEKSRYAVIFALDGNYSACFFNFTTTDWHCEGMVIPALSFDFKE